MLKKKTGTESQYLVSHLELGSDPPIGSDRETGSDTLRCCEGLHRSVGLLAAAYSRQPSLLHFFATFSALVLSSVVSFLFYSNIAMFYETL